MRLRTWVRSQSKLGMGLRAIFAIAAVGSAAIALEALARARIDDDMLRAPTRFYARPIVLQPGTEISRERVENHLGRLGYRRARRSRVGIGEYYLGSREWVIGRRTFRHYDQLNPGSVTRISIGYGDRVSSIRDQDGRRLEAVALEPELIRIAHGASLEDRIPVRLADVPQHLIDAILSVEDQHYFEHLGLDLRRIAGAALANVRARRVVQGASTITQQLAKNLYLSPRRSPIRKAREMAMALVLEARHNKEEILQAYLNQVYLGQDGAVAIHGVGRAAQHYFGKDVGQLDLSEAAVLAGIIRGPSLYSPFRHPEAAEQRRDLALELMYSRDLISEKDLQQARDARLVLRDPPEHAVRARYFVDFVAAQLRQSQGSKALEQGLAVFTTLDVELQRVAEEAVQRGLARLEAEFPRVVKEDARLQAALVALNPRTGEVLAMVGGRNYGESQFNRALHAQRQPGSSFKPIVALAALSQGTGFTLASMLEDEPLSLQTPAGLWEPANYDQRFRGSLTLREALERSLNVPFARLGLALGPERIVETAQALGIESRLIAVPSIALGSNEVTPLELTRAFGVFAAGGFRPVLHGSLGVIGRYGQIIERAQLDGEQVYSPAETFLVTSALRGAVERGTGRALRSMGFLGPVAAKSGTTNDYRDAWFIGYTPSLAVGVWVGFDDGRSIGLPGSRAALPIFARFMVGAFGRYGDGSDFTPPRGLEVVEVNSESGLRAGRGCRGEPELFLRGTAPEQSCSRYRTSPYGRSNRVLSRLEARVVPLIDELRRAFTRGRN